MTLDVNGDRYANRKPGFKTAYNDPTFDQNDQMEATIKKLRDQDKKFLHEVTPNYYGEDRKAPVRVYVKDMTASGRKLHAERMNPDNLLYSNNQLRSNTMKSRGVTQGYIQDHDGNVFADQAAEIDRQKMAQS